MKHQLPFQGTLVRTLLGLVLLLQDLPSIADDLKALEMKGDIALVPGPFFPLSRDPETGEISDDTKFGRNIPGSHFQPGPGWWALVCNANHKVPDEARGCELKATTLFITNGTHDVTENAPVASQLLHWSPMPDDVRSVASEPEKSSRLVMVFKPAGALANLDLTEGPVVTYLHDSRNSYPSPGRRGTLEVRIPTGGGQYVDVVPRLSTASIANPGEDSYNIFGNLGAAVDVLELRSANRIQRLPGKWTGCSQAALRKPKDFLWWAGDLDRDGRLDMVVSHDENEDVSLYLSSVAEGNELVGLAGRFTFSDPSLWEC